MYISKRGQRLLEHQQPLVRAHFLCAQNPWSPENPDGYINLGTAENHLVFDLLEPRLNASPGIQEHHTHYAELHGMEAFRELLSGYLSEMTGVLVSAGELAVASGSSSIIDMLVYALCEPGDGIIIPAPYYAGFDHDLKTRVQVEPVPAFTSPENGHKLTLEVLQQALLQAGRRTIKVRGILITNPNNPLGRVYDRKTLEMIVAFAREHKLQLISDELYAKSVFGDRYISLAGMSEEAGIDYHIVYGFAKDFGLSGFKTGMLFTRQEKLLKAVQELAYFMPVSNATQKILSNLLAGKAWLNHFFEENSKRLAQASGVCHQVLSEKGIHAEPNNAGFFAWLDLSRYLSSASAEAEMELYQHILENAKVNISPGQVFHGAEPGWFRLCYARPEQMIRESVSRISASLEHIQIPEKT